MRCTNPVAARRVHRHPATDDMARHPRARSPFLTSRRAFVVIRTGGTSGLHDVVVAELLDRDTRGGTAPARSPGSQSSGGQRPLDTHLVIRAYLAYLRTRRHAA